MVKIKVTFSMSPKVEFNSCNHYTEQKGYYESSKPSVHKKLKNCKLFLYQATHCYGIHDRKTPRNAIR